MRQALREHPRDSQPACAALHQWLLDRPALRTIAIYSPLPGEVDLSGVLPDHPRLTWLFPKIVGHHLSFHPGHDLVPGTLGILEPAAGTPEVALREIDAFICPGLAFDDHHHRLGRGRGFYDRLLAQARPDSLKVGICFPFQRVPDTFPEPHDVRMDEVLF
ncbi:5-formyltetrahydrofolate cyclo-ligase [bacterium]|nr:5-formyltetrahydrofolate cyclo-ligase [bacterium]